MGKFKALVVGGSGIVGRNLIEYLASTGEWEVVGLSRRRPEIQGAFEHVPLDLSRPDDQPDLWQKLSGITHVFYAARATGQTLAVELENNCTLLQNLLDKLETVAPRLQHIHLMHGTKWYGVHLSPIRLPSREDDPRHMPPNFYYSQQDLLTQRQEGRNWTWSSLRPSIIFGYSVGYPHNVVSVIGTYAAISRKLGIPLRFPGSMACYETLQTAVDVTLLNRAMAWVATQPGCANQAFNVTNGDVFRWMDLWPRIAEAFDMPFASPHSIPLARYMADKGPLWQEIVQENGLQPNRLEDIVDWNYGESHLNRSWSDIPSRLRISRSGFHAFEDTEEAFLAALRKFRDRKVLP